MAHGTVLSAGSGGDTIVDIDLSLATYPSTGKLPASCLYVSANATTAPTPVTAANALYVQPGTSAAFPVTDNSGSLTVDAPVGTPVFVRLSDGSAAITTLPVSIAATVTVTGAGGTFPVTDSGGSLTVDNAALSVTGGGVEASALRVTIASDSTGVLSVDDNGGSLTVDGTVAATQSGTWNVATVTTVTTVSAVTTVTTVSTVTSLSQFAGAAINLGTGNSSTGTLRVVLATDQPQLSNKLLVTPDAGSTVSLVPATSGGLSIYSVISSGASNQDSAAVKGSAGQVYSYALFNTTSSARYVKLYNKASGATSSDTPVLRVYLPPTGGANLSMEQGLAFGTGICIRLTTGAGDSDTGACSANDVLANILYR